MTDPITVTIPELCLVALIGPSGAGKSTFGRKHFLPTEVISSDFCRALVSDDENSLAATKDAFDVLHFIAAKRLAGGRLTIIDATSVQPEARKPIVELAKKYHVFSVAIVLNIPERICQDRNRVRPDRSFGPHVVRNQSQQLRRSMRNLQREGFRYVYVLSSPEEVEDVTIERQRLYNNLRHEHGPFDIIGDVHGCCTELEELLRVLGYVSWEPIRDPRSRGPHKRWWDGPIYTHPEGRKTIFLGDLVDRGPRTLDTVRLVRNMVVEGSALCIPGNHDMKLLRKLRGRDVQITHGLAQSLAEIEALPEGQREQFKQELANFLDGLVSHYVLDDGKLVVAHAGMKEEMQGRSSGAVRGFSLYGETTGETDKFGMPVRYNWAADYRGTAMVVYGHTPVPEPQWLNRTINIDTGCVFGGSLTALRYPENELISVPAQRTYYESVRPFLPASSGASTGTSSALSAHNTILDIEDVLGKRIVETRLMRSITIREEQAIPALEVMSRFAVDPRWLIYLPPTMSPSETSIRPGLLEHPAEAFAYFRSQGMAEVICEEKHMGSRAVIVLCRDNEVARTRFGVTEGDGVIYTRTGRRFFEDDAMQAAILSRIREALAGANLWEELSTDWVCLDGELMPWSLKAQDLLRTQYAAIGAAARHALTEAERLLRTTVSRRTGITPFAPGGSTQLGDGAVGVGKAPSGSSIPFDPAELLAQEAHHLQLSNLFTAAYRRYCWAVETVDDIRFAPFHILATEGQVHTGRDHRWHMETLAHLCSAGAPLLMATPYQVLDVTDSASQDITIRRWEELTDRGGEGMVVKPLSYIAKGSKGLVQPGVKCRGREYLRIIYGPEYTLPENLERLRQRGLGLKRSLALREFALGIEALERFVRKEPLRRVHECVFGVLALESEPVDPRL